VGVITQVLHYNVTALEPGSAYGIPSIASWSRFPEQGNEQKGAHAHSAREQALI